MNNNLLFQALREKAMPAHRALESTYPFSQQLRNEQFSVSHYTKSLIVLKAFHAFAVLQVSSFPASLLSLISPQRALDALDQDLGALAEDSISQPVFSSALAQDEPETAIAFAYVWMGSSMGGAIIHRWLQSHHPNLPAEYYRVMAETGQEWEPFKVAVTDFAQQHRIDVDKAATSALSVFESLIAAAETFAPPEVE